MFKTIIFLGTAVLGLSFWATPAEAQYYDHHHYYHSPYGGFGHHLYHHDLDYRAYSRGLYHDYAHRRPMNWYEHEALHDDLDHDAYHDHLEHRSYHRRYYPYYGYGGGAYYSRPGIYLRFGW